MHGDLVLSMPKDVGDLRKSFVIGDLVTFDGTPGLWRVVGVRKTKLAVDRVKDTKH